MDLDLIWPMHCPWECHQIGGRWIAENPDCPYHGHHDYLSDEEKLSMLESKQHEISL